MIEKKVGNIFELVGTGKNFLHGILIMETFITIHHISNLLKVKMLLYITIHHILSNKTVYNTENNL